VMKNGSSSATTVYGGTTLPFVISTGFAKGRSASRQSSC
jgi:hypothetical protein